MCKNGRNYCSPLVALIKSEGEEKALPIIVMALGKKAKKDARNISR